MSLIACAKLYRRRLFDGIDFPKGMYYEDAATTYKLIFRSRNIAFGTEELYGYRMRPDSIMKTSFSPKMLCVVPITQQLYKDVTDKFSDLKKPASSIAFSVNRSVYLNLPFSRRKERLQIWAEMKKYRSTIIFDPRARKRERIVALLSYLGADLSHLLLAWAYRRQQMMG